jgi:hypothetical protein
MDFVRVKPVIYNTPCSDKMQEKKDKDGRKPCAPTMNATFHRS